MRLACALQPDQELEDAALGLLDLGGERSGSDRSSVRPKRLLSGEQLADRGARPASCRRPRGGRRRAVSRRGSGSPRRRTARGRGAGRSSGGVEREVAEVLVVDGVELVLVDQPHDVGELHRQHAARREDDLHAGDEVVEIRHLREHVVAEEQVGRAAVRRELLGQLDSEEAHQGGHALRFGGRGDVGRRLDAERRDAGLDEPLQEIAVVARQLDDQARSGRSRSGRSSCPCSRGRARPSCRRRTRSTRTR